MTTTIYSGEITTKDPQSVEFFWVNWGERKLPSGVNVAVSTWTITGPDAALTYDEAGVTGQITRLRLSGGTARKKYVVTNHIVTNETPTQEDDASFTVLIESK